LGGIKNLKTLDIREKEIIGKNIRTLRKQCGLTQTFLAEEMGKTVDHIAHVESGHNGVSMRMLLDICAVLGVSPNDVLEGAYNKGLE
jgi:Predicted transcriptional regulators